MKKYLKTVFLHLDGIALSPIYETLNSHSIDEYIMSSNKFKPNHIIDKYKANSGYFNIVLKILEAQGVIKRNKTDNYLKVTDFGKEILSKANLFKGFKNYYDESNNLIKNDCADADSIKKHFNLIENSYNSIKNNDNLIKNYLEGGLVAPIVILYSFKDRKEFPDFVVNFLQNANLINLHNKPTKKGEYIFSKCHAYGVPTSYIKTFSHLDDLLFGDFKKIWIKDSFNNEYHVNRALNVWGSGKSHKNYFKHIDKFIYQIFNKPLEQQPLGISDMGCGDGTFLLHLYDFIKENTLRGKNLKTHPIHLVGADYNQEALQATLQTFKNADIKPLTIVADIANPDAFNKNLKNLHNIKLSELLNVRTFLDHNRSYTSTEICTEKYNKTSDYSFCWKGKKINATDIQDNLIAHFKRWKRLTSKYGLILIELHSTGIKDTQNNIGTIPMISYIATHGFSDQFIVEHNIYKECIKKAGLNILEKFEVTYPNQSLKMVSIHMLN
ncbi:MAG: hypothetical protein CBC84_001460 [Pelagibacteraceae bacterium TMED124]|nr:hypothetical protein [Candidatus Neomarinimicrobiota bacterium]RPG18595.1 MAG: hypothetical protein CBC84_001460 [Pelagibacteraceae bacterium TMED124]